MSIHNGKLQQALIGLMGFATAVASSPKRLDAWARPGPTDYGREEGEGGPGDGSQALLQALLRKACGSHAISHAAVWQAGS